jgi:hypothetical protein
MPDGKLSSEQLQVFLACTSRFDDIVQKLPIKVRATGTDFDTSIDLKKALSDEQAIHAVIRYFNLCAEEFYLFKHGLIAQEVWDLWKSQIEAMFKEQFVIIIWRSISKQYVHQADFFNFANGSLSS